MPPGARAAWDFARLVRKWGWRRGRDSNPRYGFPYAGLANLCLKPLGHLSARQELRSSAARCAPAPGRLAKRRNIAAEDAARRVAPGPRGGAFDGGEGGIRTLETLARLAVFKTAAINRSATSPRGQDQCVETSSSPLMQASRGVMQREVSGGTALNGATRLMPVRRYRAIRKRDRKGADVRGVAAFGARALRCELRRFRRPSAPGVARR